MSVLAAFDFQPIVDWIVGHIGPIFIAVFFFILPVLRGINEQAKKKRQMEEAARRRAEPDESRPAEEVDEGRKAFEALLRGEEPARRAPVAEPPPLARTAPPPLRPIEGSETQPELSGRLSDFEDTPTEDEEESALDEEKLAREMNDRLLREEMQRRSDFLAREKELAARKTVAPDGLVTLAPEEVAIAPAAARSAPALFTATGAGRRAELRRAILAREVLGPPVALRTHIDALGPTALSG